MSFFKFSRRSLSSLRKNWEWFRLIRERSKNTNRNLNVVEVGVGTGGSLAIACLGLVGRGSRSSKSDTVMGFDLFDGTQIYSEVDTAEEGFHLALQAEKALSERRRLSTLGTKRIVRELIFETGFNGRLELVQGDAALTIGESSLPKTADFLRISCNFYSPVKVVLAELIPRVSDSGIVILDGVKFWSAFRRAVTESPEMGSLTLLAVIEDAEVYSRIETTLPVPRVR